MPVFVKWSFPIQRNACQEFGTQNEQCIRSIREAGYRRVVCVQERGNAREDQRVKGTMAVPIPELSPLRCLLSVNFWLLFFSFCIGAHPSYALSCKSLRILPARQSKPVPENAWELICCRPACMRGV